jgi:hypothetical protein
VIIDGRFPSGGRMATVAIWTKALFVKIIRLMAGIAIGGSTLENVIDMAGLTSCIGVFAIQLECGQIVIKGSRGPAGGFVACCTIDAITPLVGILCLMA